jgi:hypothetical protein
MFVGAAHTIMLAVNNMMMKKFMKDMLYEAANVLSSATRDQMTRTAKRNWMRHPALGAARGRVKTQS